MTNPASDLEPIPQELAYAAQLQGLLPSGLAWATARDTIAWGLLRGLGCGLARAHLRAVDLARESDPRSALELLPEWEEFLGLPDECTGELTDVLDRRAAVVSRLLEPGGQDPAYFIELAARYGFEIEIVEYPTATVGWSSCGDPMTTNGDPALVGATSCGESLGLLLGWPWVFDVLSSAFTVQHAVAGSSVGLPLATWGNDLLECIIRRAAPAHCMVRFTYTLGLQPDPALVTLSLPSPAVP